MEYLAYPAGQNSFECGCCGHFFTDRQDFCPNCEEPLLFQEEEENEGN